MRNLKRITICCVAAAAVMMVQACCTEIASAAPQAGCDTFVAGSPMSQCGCAGGACDGTCGNRGNGGLFGNRGCNSCGQRGCRGCNRGVQCPDCNNCFPEEYCKLTVEKGEDEYTCYEVDYKTICIPKVTFPWQKRNRGCGGGGLCNGSCGGSCDGFAAGGCDGAGGCNGACGGACDGFAAGGCDGAGCGRCGGAGCGNRCGACRGAGCRICQNRKEGCCPPAGIDVPCNPCAEARSVKILKKKTYKCPKCQCKWEVVKPELPKAPEASPPIQQPTPAQPASTIIPFRGQPNAAPQMQHPAPSPSLNNDYYGRQMAPMQHVPQRMALQPQMGKGPEFSYYDAPPAEGRSWSLRDLMRRRQAAQQHSQQGTIR